ncbi:MAG: tripartite tricarboxylate transporter substrate binding protein, partial [Comamonadaceae bacterium]
MQRRAFLPLLSAGILAGSALLSPAAAQSPDVTGQTIRVIVGFPAGGTADAVARMFAQELQKRTGATFVVENRAGGEAHD